MKTYYQNGIMDDINYFLSDSDGFAVQYSRNDILDVFYYKNDFLVQEIDVQLVNLFDVFQDMCFKDRDLYYKESCNIPMGIYIGGQSSEISIGKEEFIRLKDEYAQYIPDLLKHIYLGDCQFLVSTIQNLIQSVEYCFIQYFVQISQIELSDRVNKENDIYYVSSERSRQLNFLIETFFTKIYSILDVMVKIIYELENPVVNFESIKKLKCSQKIFGDKKEISINQKEGSIFEDCEIIKQIKDIRNEVVHNGTWELNPKFYLVVNNNRIERRYMMFPEFEEGLLSRVKNRGRFFSSGKTINEAIVEIHDEFYKRLLDTLRYINSKEYLSSIVFSKGSSNT